MHPDSNLHTLPADGDTPLDPVELGHRLAVFSDGRIWEERQVLTEIHAHTETIIHSAYEIGRRLIWTKEVLGHGQFGEWCQANLPFSERTIRNYMRVANFLVAHPKLLQPLAKAGLRKTLLLTSQPPELIDELVQDGHLAEVPVEELGDVPYVELKKRLEEQRSQVEELTTKLADRDRELADAKEALADDTLQKSKLDEYAERTLKEGWSQFEAAIERLHGDLTVLAMRHDELPPGVLARLTGMIEAAQAHAEHTALAWRAQLGQDVYGAHLQEVMHRAEAVGHPIPETQVIPFAGSSEG